MPDDNTLLEVPQELQDAQAKLFGFAEEKIAPNQLGTFESKVINAFMSIAPKIIAAHVKEKACAILATAITIDVFKAYGIKGEPWPCRVKLYNQIAARRLINAKNNNTMPDSEGKMRALLLKGGGWSIALGYPQISGAGEVLESAGIWPGHLVTVFKGFEVPRFIDLTLNQANRPNKNMYLQPECLPISQTVLDGNTQLAGFFGEYQNVFVIYEQAGADYGFCKADDWFDLERRKNIVEAIRYQMDKQIRY